MKRLQRSTFVMTDLQHEREIFEAAMDIPPSEARDAYLQQACGEDSALRHRIIALLRASESAIGFLPGTPEQQPFSAEDASLSEGPRTVIGRYKLLEPIGEGGFGVVYMAEQTEPEWHDQVLAWRRVDRREIRTAHTQSFPDTQVAHGLRATGFELIT